MSQNIFSDINPSATSGNDLATILNDFKDAVASGFSGTARPANLQAGGYWIDTTLAPTPDFLWKYMMWTGTTDILVFTLNINTNTILIAGTTGTYTVSQTSADAVGPIIALLKKRIATNGQTLVGDVLGEVQFKSTDDLGAAMISARIKAVSNNSTTSSQAGAYLVFEEINTNSGSITEKMRLIDGKLGVGTAAPTTAIHITSLTGFTNERIDDSATGPVSHMKKSRVAGSGQVLSGDSLGKYNFKSTDETGAEIDGAVVIESFATQNHSSTAQGSKVTVGIKKTGATTATEKMSIGDVLNFPEGHQTKNEIIGTSGTAATNVKLHRSAAGKVQIVLGNDATAEGSEATVLAELSGKHESFTDAGKPAAGQSGRVIWISDLTKLQYDNGSAWIDVGNLANPMTTGGDIIYGGASGVVTRLANGTAGQYLKSQGTTLAPAWTSFTTPTIQRFTSGSGTYTTPANVKYIKVTLAGGGGGGGGAGTGNGAGGGGGTTTFGSSLLTATGGGGGASTTSGGGAGGSGGSNTITSGTTINSIAGASGSNGVRLNDGSGGTGATTAFGGGGGSGTAGSTNSGSGGGGGGSGFTFGGGGGGSGGYIQVQIDSPSATYAYAVGAAGTAGAGTGAAGAGGSGVIIVEEFYQ